LPSAAIRTLLAWEELVLGLTRAGNQDISGGQVVYVLPETANQFSNASFNASIDGFGHPWRRPAGHPRQH